MQDLLNREVLDTIASQYRMAAVEAVRDFADQHADEDRLTGALASVIRTTVRGQMEGSDGHRYRWETTLKAVRGRGAHSPEKSLGADAFLEIALVDEDKGLLRRKTLPIQAKKAWEGTDSKLVNQVEKMMASAGDCLVVVYGPVGYVAIKGAAVLATGGSRSRLPREAVMPLGSALGDDFMRCLIGTTRVRFDVDHQALMHAAPEEASIPVSAPYLLRTTIFRENSKHQPTVRGDLVDYLCQELIGPSSDEEILSESPTQRYSAGVLFPTQQRILELDDANTDDVTAEDNSGSDPLVTDEKERPEPHLHGGIEDAPDTAYDESVLLANSYYPSAMGVSCLVAANAERLVVHASASIYRSAVVPRGGASERAPRQTRVWQRSPLVLPAIVFTLPAATPHMKEETLAENLKLRCVSRPHGNGRLLVTISLYNAAQARATSKPPSASSCFFQAGFEARHPDGRDIFLEYLPVGRAGVPDEEDASLRLLYRSRRQFAVGHGCAAEWSEVPPANATNVRTEAMPRCIVPPVEPRSGDLCGLQMFHLAGLDGSSDEEMVTNLTTVVDQYAAWIADQRSQADGLAAQFRATAARHLDECEIALRRMRRGVQLLAQDPNDALAFRLANRAMLMQQHHSRRPRRSVSADWTSLPGDYQPTDGQAGRWRTFQLAFILMNIGSFVSAGRETYDATRDVVDLIWFPTGGGKTEAYLGLAAYVMLSRRIRRPENGGCTVLMRYTLRLLTAQQFQRASSLLCACEVLRKENTRRLGKESFSIGLWVGLSATPNTRDEAVRSVNRMVRSRDVTDNKFQILACPWCGTAMDDPFHLGYRVSSTQPKTVVLICPERRCIFSQTQNVLPIRVIDEDVYDRPPTLLLGTVDKFAMLSFKPEAAAIFAVNTPHDPPELVIQDELHLISGPLGSMVGLYETVIDYLCSWKGARPKIVASTATIRRAREQCGALYDRDTFQFPPPALDIGDSFFAIEKKESPGRLYLGVFPSASPSPVTALVRTASGLLQGIKSVPFPSGGEEARDPYWTLLQYFSSLRELGRAATLVEQDIPEYIGTIARRYSLPREEIRRIAPPVELTSRLTAQEIPEILERLKVSYPANGEVGERPIDTLLATNMISVGVDVDRLGLMVVVGQPKSTSEYIQASSRVGRSVKAPGLVITLYNAGKPRDRSHFEQFRSYHEAFYRHVEPTSVTPFTVPVLERVLHALLVIVVRTICQVSTPNSFDPDDPRLGPFISFLERRAERVDPEHSPVLIQMLRARIRHWHRFKPEEWGGFTATDGNRLIYPAGVEPRPDLDDDSWPTPASMRNVDTECSARVIRMFAEPETLE